MQLSLLKIFYIFIIYFIYRERVRAHACNVSGRDRTLFSSHFIISLWGMLSCPYRWLCMKMTHKFVSPAQTFVFHFPQINFTWPFCWLSSGLRISTNPRPNSWSSSDKSGLLKALSMVQPCTQLHKPGMFGSPFTSSYSPQNIQFVIHSHQV